MVKVIIADDEEKVCQLIYNLIDWEESGMYAAGMVHNGIDALALIRAEMPDLVITDIRMPGCDGLELIRKAKEIKKDLEFIIISGYRHFDYAKNAMKFGVEDYLLKPVNQEELALTLGKIRKKYEEKSQKANQEKEWQHYKQTNKKSMRHKFIQDFVLAGHSAPDPDETRNVFHYRFGTGCYQIAVIKFDLGKKRELGSGREVLIKKMKQIAEGILGNVCRELETEPQADSLICLLHYEDKEKKIVRKCLKNILDELTVQKNIFGDIPFTIAVSSVKESYETLPFLWKEADKKIQERIIRGTEKIIEDPVTPSLREAAEPIVAEVYQIMDKSLETLDKERILETTALLQGKLDLYKAAGFEIITILMEVSNIYLTLLKKYGLANHNLLFYDDFYTAINSCSNKKEMFVCLEALLESSLDTIEREKKQQNAKPIRLAKQYIQKHYMDNLTLEEVGEVAGFNASYFSSLFKKESGKNFLEYVSEVRMEKAKELLKETNHSVAVICEEVGYSDVKHFTKSFKKNSGLNPNQYRKIYS